MAKSWQELADDVRQMSQQMRNMAEATEGIAAIIQGADPDAVFSVIQVLSEALQAVAAKIDALAALAPQL